MASGSEPCFCLQYPPCLQYLLPTFRLPSAPHLSKRGARAGYHAGRCRMPNGTMARPPGSTSVQTARAKLNEQEHRSTRGEAALTYPSQEPTWHQSRYQDQGTLKLGAGSRSAYAQCPRPPRCSPPGCGQCAGDERRRSGEGSSFATQARGLVPCGVATHGAGLTRS